MTTPAKVSEDVKEEVSEDVKEEVSEDVKEEVKVNYVFIATLKANGFNDLGQAIDVLFNKGGFSSQESLTAANDFLKTYNEDPTSFNEIGIELPQINESQKLVKGWTEKKDILLTFEEIAVYARMVLEIGILQNKLRLFIFTRTGEIKNDVVKPDYKKLKDLKKA